MAPGRQAAGPGNGGRHEPESGLPARFGESSSRRAAHGPGASRSWPTTNYLSGLERGATTWERGETLGQHGGDAGFIMQALSEDLDLFILEYLRVNEGYC